MSCVKYLLFVYNVIAAVMGVALLAIGVMVKLNVTSLPYVNTSFAAISLIVVGCLIFVVSFFGCWGAIQEVSSMMITYAGFLLIFVILQVAVGVFCFVYLQNVNDNDLRGPYTSTFNKYWSNSANQDIIDTVQSNFKCCGVDSSLDYLRTFGKDTIPWSCCGNDKDRICNVMPHRIYSTGCITKLVDTTRNYGSLVGGVVCGIAAAEVLGIIFSLCLANAIRNEQRRGYRV